MHTEMGTPWIVNQSREAKPSGRRLGDLHWILQASTSFRQIIHTSHAEILYANIRQLPKRSNSKTVSICFISFDIQQE